MATAATPTTATDAPTTDTRDGPPIQSLSDDEGRAIFDQEAQRTVGLSGEEFLRRYDAGKFDDAIDGPDHLKLIDLIMLIPLAR